jgi:carbon starvation regulatory protein
VESIGAISNARKEPPLEWTDDDTDAPLPQHARQA